MLELLDVSKNYPSPGQTGPLEVLKGISLRLEQGERLAVVGPSGSGKSTLMNIAGGLDRPTSGRVLLEGADLSQMSDRELAAVRNRHIGFVFQLHHLLPQCTLLENVLIPTIAAGFGGGDVRQRAAELLESVGLADRADHLPGELSAGQCQRAALVRALINRPQIILADEPTGSLDSASAGAIAELLIELNEKRKVTIVVATHSMSLAGRIGGVMELKAGMLYPKV